MRVSLKIKHWKTWGIPLLLFTFVSVLRIVGITRADLLSDNALDSLRAISWIDYIGGEIFSPQQLSYTPLWWSGLSFQDAPPLVFAIQHVFFELFGDTTFIARLPFVLAGIATVVLMYRSVARLRDNKTALLSSFILGISSYATWMAHSGYLEGIEQFFMVAAFFAFISFVQSPRRYRYAWIGCASLALALISKYTSVFMLPAMLILLAINHAKPFFTMEKIDKWTIGVQVFVVILSPVLVYNFFLYQFRGHFDSAFSAMIGMHSPDFGIISARAITAPEIGNLLGPFMTIFETSSLPFALLLLSGFVVLFVKIIRRNSDALEQALRLVFTFALLMFAFFPGGVRFYPILVPFFALALGLALMDLMQRLLAQPKDIVSRSLVSVGMFIFVMIMFGEILYNINTNILITPIGKAGVTYSPHRLKNLGFNQLDEFLRRYRIEHISDRTPAPGVVKSIFPIRPEYQKFTSIVMYDERIHWFATSWYLLRYQINDRIPVFPETWLLDGDIAGLKSYTKRSFPNAYSVYFISPASKEAIDPVKGRLADFELFAPLPAELWASDLPYASIEDMRGSEVFRVYRIDL